VLGRALVGIILGLLGAGTITAQQTVPAAGSLAQPTNAAPVVIPRATQYDLPSRINGQTYRIMVSLPFMFDPAAAYPVLYVLDANTIFGIVTDVAHFQSFAKVTAPAIVVGIGYPTDDLNEWVRRRALDMTPTPSPKPDKAGKNGGGDAFLRVIDEEVKPFLATRYKIDRSKQIIFGFSLGGLIALRNLFRNPTAFATYILASPSIWWDNKTVLADEEAFSKRARSGDLLLTVILTSARDEQYHDNDPKLLAEAQSGSRMVDNASEIAARLTALNPEKIKVFRVIFDGEIHNTVTAAAVSRGLRLALPPK
jgi:hypothetical protein